MKSIRYIGLAFALALLTCAFAASAAEASPEFYNCVHLAFHGMYEAGCLTVGSGNYERQELTEKVAFSSKLGATELVGAETLKCSGGSSKGELNGAKAAEKIVVTFTGCEAPGGACKIKSPSAGAGEVVTADLKGKLGAVAESEAKSKVGLSLEPETSGSTEFTTVEGTCISKVHVAFKSSTSRIIGELAPVGVFGTTGELIFKRSGSGQAIKTFEGGGETTDGLEVFGAKAGFEQLTDNITFAEMLEVLW